MDAAMRSTAAHLPQADVAAVFNHVIRLGVKTDDAFALASAAGAARRALLLETREVRLGQAECGQNRGVLRVRDRILRAQMPIAKQYMHTVNKTAVAETAAPEYDRPACAARSDAPPPPA